MEVRLTAELDAPPDWEEVVDELRLGLERRGLVLGAEALTGEDGAPMARVTESAPGRLVLSLEAVDWAPDARAEVELAVDGTRLSLVRRGDAIVRDPLAWVAGAVAGGVLAAWAPEAVADWVTDRSARRPFGAGARGVYRDPRHHRPNFLAILDRLSLTAADELLEVGCGGGALLADALATGCRAAGADHSADMVRLARAVNSDAVADGRLEVVRADATSLPFGSERFTCAAMTGVIGFLPDAVAALREIRRCLRPGGRLAVFTGSALLRGTPAAPEPIASRLRFYTPEELEGIAHAAGFASAAVEHPDLEPFARAAGLAEDDVAMFSDPAGSLLLIAVR